MINTVALLLDSNCVLSLEFTLQPIPRYCIICLTFEFRVSPLSIFVKNLYCSRFLFSELAFHYYFHLFLHFIIFVCCGNYNRSDRIIESDRCMVKVDIYLDAVKG